MKRWLAALAAVGSIGCMPLNDGHAQAPDGSRPPEATLAALRADAAVRAGVPADQVKLESSQAVTWRDSSLGCPQPGMSYAQVLVPGWQVRLRAGDKLIDYHLGRRGNWQRCPADRAQEPLPANPAV
ncbi:MAG: hypothetical protein QM722_01965 [Piscinibacter sp.]